MKNNILILLTGIFSLLYILEMAQFAENMENMAEKRDAELERVRKLTDKYVR